MADVRRQRPRDLDSRPDRRTAAGSDVIPAMGPANRAPGISIMGWPSWDGYPDLMGGPDGLLVGIMGGGDHGTRLDLFGASDARFVDSLFSRPRDER
jgi:hypothetical protein